MVKLSKVDFNSFYLTLINKEKRKSLKICDYGCGTGDFVVKARSLGYKNTIGYDVQRFWDQKLEGTLKLIEPNQKISEKFDVVLSNQVFEHVADHDSYLQNCFRMTKKNGLVIISFPPKDVWLEPHLFFPFIHRFSPETQIVKLFLIAIYLFSGKIFTKNISISEWVENRRLYLENEVNYLWRREVESKLKRHGFIFTDITDDVVKGRYSKYGQVLIKCLGGWRLIGLTLVLKKF